MMMYPRYSTFQASTEVERSGGFELMEVSCKANLTRGLSGVISTP